MALRIMARLLLFEAQLLHFSHDQRNEQREKKQRLGIGLQKRAQPHGACVNILKPQCCNDEHENRYKPLRPFDGKYGLYAAQCVAQPRANGRQLQRQPNEYEQRLRALKGIGKSARYAQSVQWKGDVCRGAVGEEQRVEQIARDTQSRSGKAGLEPHAHGTRQLWPIDPEHGQPGGHGQRGQGRFADGL